MGILPWVWYGGRAGVAVLYSVVVGAVREFWVKTAAADRKIGEQTARNIPLNATINTSVDDNPGSSVSGAGSLTITFTPTELTTTVTPSTVSFSLSNSGGRGASGVSYNQSVTVIGDDPIDVEISGTAQVTSAFSTNSDGDPNFSATSAICNIRIVVGFNPVVSALNDWGVVLGVGANGAGNGDAGDLETGSTTGSISKYTETVLPLLNGLYGFIRTNPSYTGNPIDATPDGGELLNPDGLLSSSSITATNSTNFASITSMTMLITTSSIEPSRNNQVLGSSYIVLISATTPSYFYSFSITNKSFVFSGNDSIFTLSVQPVATSDPLGTLPALNTLAQYAGNLRDGDIFYGPYQSGSGLLPEYSVGDTLTPFSDDWRSLIVDFTPDLSSASSCLADLIYLPDSILNGGNLYAIALDQIISGQSLRDRLQTSADTVAATLTTQTATSGVSCTLGTAAESTVQIPSPGRGTVEGITYLP